MTDNALRVVPQIISVVWGIGVFIIFALTLALPHRPKVLPGSSGHREKGEDTEHEVIRADGFIDTFANQAQEAGGSIPVLVMVGLPVILISWLLYMILNWTPK